jgi:hypothetical protein
VTVVSVLVDPWLFCAVKVYVVVPAGFTDTDEPPTWPILGAIDSTGAGLPVTTQERVEFPPSAIVPGLAEKEMMLGVELGVLVWFSTGRVEALIDPDSPELLPWVS